jgi:hypothetical protein
MIETAKLELIHKFNIVEEEVNQFDSAFLIDYLKYHHKKHYGESSILFLGFNEEEVEKLKLHASKYNLKINVRISTTLSFVCVNNDFEDKKRIFKAKELGAVILNKNEFFELFKDSEYRIFENDLIYLSTIPENFRIVKPLSNFNEDVVVQSFSFESESSYLTNLFLQTCTCKEFSSNNKINYEKGDLRRFCKHLISEYKYSFTPIEISEFKRFLIENQYSLKRNFKEINLEKISLPIYLSYENNNDWCDIYFPVKDSFSKYSYNHMEERFSYDDKPHGHVVTLRAELNKLFGSKKPVIVKKINKKTVQNQNDGCASVFIIGILFICIFKYLIN